MFILCDTCSILMLLRIAPEMFEEQRYQCVTIQEVRNEFVRQTKFKTKYPWRVEFAGKIKPLPNSKMNTTDCENFCALIRNILETGVINKKSGRNILLSKVDIQLIATAVAHGYEISSVDRDLVEFAFQQFELQNASPLGIINRWIENGLIEWGPEMQIVLKDWTVTQEASQPKKDITHFEELTGKIYPGP